VKSGAPIKKTGELSTTVVIRDLWEFTRRAKVRSALDDDWGTKLRVEAGKVRLRDELLNETLFRSLAHSQPRYESAALRDFGPGDVPPFC
jgi:hypothetical protein